MTLLSFFITFAVLLAVVLVLRTQLKKTTALETSAENTEPSAEPEDTETEQEELRTPNWSQHGLRLSDDNQLFPSQFWSTFAISKDGLLANSPQPKYCLEKPEKDLFAFIVDETITDDSTQQQERIICFVIRSYQLETEPEPVKIYSNALKATAESFMDTMIYYKNTAPSEAVDFDKLIEDSLLIFQSMASSAESSKKELWLAQM